MCQLYESGDAGPTSYGKGRQIRMPPFCGATARMYDRLAVTVAPLCVSSFSQPFLSLFGWKFAEAFRFPKEGGEGEV